MTEENGRSESVAKGLPEGPWWASQSSDDHRIFHILCDGDGLSRVVVTIQQEDEETGAELARLVAAIPQMREALEALYMQAMQSNVNSPENDWGRLALAQARLAILNADGELETPEYGTPMPPPAWRITQR